MYADIVINVPHLTTSYCYAIPDALEGLVAPGHLVTQPFGGRRAQGIVIALLETAAVSRVSEIEDLVDPDPVLTPEQLALGLWIADTYGLAH
jgi:primosomal protein N' (replication factor Y)